MQKKRDEEISGFLFSKPGSVLAEAARFLALSGGWLRPGCKLDLKSAAWIVSAQDQDQEIERS